MTNNYQESELKAAKRAEIERLWFAEEATNKELLEAYKSLDAKEEVPLIRFSKQDTKIIETFKHYLNS